MKNILILAAISLLSLHIFAHPVDSNPRGISDTSLASSYAEHKNAQSRRSEKITMSASISAAYSKAQDLYLLRRKEYNEQMVRLMMVETGPVRKDMEKELEDYKNSMDTAKKTVEVYETRFDTSGKSKLD